MPTAERNFSSNKHMEDIGEIYHKERYRQKRKSHRQYSPEKSSARKYMKISSVKETVDVSSKSDPSGTSKKNQQDTSKKVRNSSVRVEGRRSPIKKLRIKLPKPPVDSSEDNHEVPKAKAEISKLAYNTYYSEDPTAVLSNRKSEISFALSLPKKNETVDVEKAFGNDCSFLPRPLTPTNLDDLVPAEEVQKTENEFKEASFVASEHLESHNANITSLDPEIKPTNLDSSMSSSELPSVTIVESVAVSKPVINPTLTTALDSSKRVSVFIPPSNLATEATGDKVLPSKPLVNLNNICIEKPAASSMSQATSSSTTKSVITVPSNAATLLVSGQTLKISSGKFLQLLSKGPVSIKAKNTIVPTLVKSGKPGELTSQRLLLSTNAGVTEQSTSVPQKIETGSTPTYVKLSAPNTQQNFKQLQNFKSPQAIAGPVRMETPAEMAEIRLAIKALNKDLQLDSVTSATNANEEPGYSICFAKPDGSIISRKVIRPPIRTTVRPSHPSFL